ncbi:uncharacterized protein LOC118745879, partial [Rhagoletis pomonella]|uniref:uncharacterized protein LOC118745879 n=1 Tax=Rhagoletis pomonella TaxID=28610 RepID=UPI001785E7D0
MIRRSIFLHLDTPAIHNNVRLFTTNFGRLYLNHRLAKRSADDAEHSTAEQLVAKDEEVTLKGGGNAGSTLSQALNKYFGNNDSKTFYVGDSSKGKENLPNLGIESIYWKRIIGLLEEILHVDEVRRAQARVIDIKNQLHSTGNKKRTIQRNVVELQQEQSKLYKDFKTNRSSTQYIELIRKEFDWPEVILERTVQIAAH